jgi:hypothetical protein
MLNLLFSTGRQLLAVSTRTLSERVLEISGVNQYAGTYGLT